jgi:hypothetical protein
VIHCPYCSRAAVTTQKEVTPSWENARKDWETDVNVTERAHCDVCKLDFVEERHLKALWPVVDMGRWRLPGG